MKDFLIGGYNRPSRASTTVLKDEVNDFEVEHEMKTIKKLPAELLDEVDEEYKDELKGSNSQNATEPVQFMNQQQQEISIIQGGKENETFTEPEFMVQNFPEDPNKKPHYVELDDEDEKKVGLRFTKNELEEVFHDGPVMPMKHEGAFEVKAQYMDELSPAKSPKNEEQKTLNQAQPKFKVETISPLADPNSKINTEIVLRDMNFNQGFNFENKFIMGDGQSADGTRTLFDDNYKFNLKTIIIENCTFSSQTQFD